jgi:hypothetical protein
MEGGRGHDYVRGEPGRHSSVPKPPTTPPTTPPVPTPTPTTTPTGGPIVLPPQLRDDLCAALSQILVPLPAQINGLPPWVIALLPAAITTQIPADLLQVVTLNCPTA